LHEAYAPNAETATSHQMCQIRRGPHECGEKGADETGRAVPRHLDFRIGRVLAEPPILARAPLDAPVSVLAFDARQHELGARCTLAGRPRIRPLVLERTVPKQTRRRRRPRARPSPQSGSMGACTDGFFVAREPDRQIDWSDCKRGGKWRRGITRSSSRMRTQAIKRLVNSEHLTIGKRINAVPTIRSFKAILCSKRATDGAIARKRGPQRSLSS
jgi:hypothetical protein